MRADGAYGETVGLEDATPAWLSPAGRGLGICGDQSSIRGVGAAILRDGPATTDRHRTAGTRPSPEPVATNRAAKTILIIDDELSHAEVLTILLEQEGYSVRTAANGQEGLRLVAEVSPQLVVLDFMMPLMNGAEMARALRADPDTRHIRILMNSAVNEASVREQFPDYDAFLRKPYLLGHLLSLIGSLLATPRD
ncbi:MAG: hypothetical protein NVS9B10_23270 [Nevskia sp.]